MHRIFLDFIDRLADAVDDVAFRDALAGASVALDFPFFAYACVPLPRRSEPRVISTYPSRWITHYLNSHYDRIDPVVSQALRDIDPFAWGQSAAPARLSKSQQQLFDEAAGFGLRSGFAIPIHDRHGFTAVVSFATDERSPIVRQRITEHGRVLQLLAMYFHAQARRKFSGSRIVDGVTLSPREFECLRWAAAGKSAWDIALILGISRRTAAYHLDNAKAKLGVRTIVQAVVRLAAAGLVE